MHQILVFVLIVVVLTAAALWVIARTLPPDTHWLANIIVGALALLALAAKLLPMAGL